MSGNAVAAAASTLNNGVEELTRAAAFSNETTIASLTVCEQATRRLEFLHVELGVGQLPQSGGERPHLNVLLPLAELERRARAAALDFGSRLSPADLRMLARDARVVPIVLDGESQPLDVGRARRTIPDGLRRAVAARDRGCAAPGCGRPPSWCGCTMCAPGSSVGRPSCTTA